MSVIRSIGRWWRDVAWGRHRRIVILAAVAVLLIIALAVGYVVVLLDRIQRIDVTLPGSAAGGTTYLIVGTDSRAKLTTPEAREAFGVIGGERADILLVLRVPDDGRTPALMSVPRDLLVLNGPGRPVGLQRLALTWLDGPQGTIDALCHSIGIGVDHLAVLDLSGFATVVDAIGGIDLTIPDVPVRDEKTGFTWPFTVPLHMDGSTALRYVRSRHLEHFDGVNWVPLPNQRGEQARRVIEQVGRDAPLSPLDPVGFHDFIWAGTGVIRVDDGAGFGDLRGLANAVRRVSSAADVELPVIADNGSIPFTQLQPGAAKALREVGAGGKACSPAALPQARA